MSHSRDQIRHLHFTKGETEAQRGTKTCPGSHRALAATKAQLPSPPGLTGPQPPWPRPHHPIRMTVTCVTPVFPQWGPAARDVAEEVSPVAEYGTQGSETCLSLWPDAHGGSIIQVIGLEPPGGGGRARCSQDGQLAGLRGAAGPRELSPLTDGWGQLPVAGHPRHEPRGHLCGRPRWPPAQRLALNVHKAFCSRSGGWAGSIEGPLSEEGAAC